MGMLTEGQRDRWPWLLVAAAYGWFADATMTGASIGAQVPGAFVPTYTWALLTGLVAVFAVWVWLVNGVRTSAALFATAITLHVGRSIDLAVVGTPSGSALNGVAAALVIVIWVADRRRIRRGA